MKRDWVMDASPNTGFCQFLLEQLPSRDPYDIEVVDRPRSLWHIGKDNRVLCFSEQSIVCCRPLDPLSVPRGQTAQLNLKDSRLNRIQAAVIPLHLMDVLPDLAVFP